ncbi:hypothetical protein BOV89_12855 [Solemya velum gill symbiont]|nr:hypothetical protein BOV89_12855 [Solemya velum gill symbiont]
MPRLCINGVVWRTVAIYLNKKLIHLIRTDERFLKVKENIEKTDVLIVDEVSMISSKVLSQVQFICKQMTNPSELLVVFK